MQPRIYSIDSYRSILEAAIASGRECVDFEASPAADRRVLYLRHDVDFSLKMAVEWARVNASIGVSATFFVLLRASSYNLHGYRAADRLGELDRLGQRIGFHYASPLGHKGSYDEHLRSDFSAAHAIFPGLRPVFSWHNPAIEVLEAHRERSQIGSLLNVYSSRFTTDVAYHADSNMRYTVDELIRFVTDGPQRVHLLLHPVYWMGGGENVADALARVLIYGVREQEEQLLDNATYRECFPQGMPERLLTAFAEEW